MFCVLSINFLPLFFATVTELSVPPVSGWLTARQDQLNSSGPCSSQSEPACTRGCAGWAPPRGSRSCSGRCCRSGGTAGRGEGKLGCSSWKERHPAGNGYPRCSGYDWNKKKNKKREEGRGWKCNKLFPDMLKGPDRQFNTQFTAGRKLGASQWKCHYFITYLFLLTIFHLCVLNGQTSHPFLSFSSKAKAKSIFNPLCHCPHITVSPGLPQSVL